MLNSLKSLERVERTPRERVAFGEEAARLLKNEVFEEMFRMAERSFLEEWLGGTTVEARERAHAKITVLEDVRLALFDINQDGAVAADALERERAPRRS